jgi:hypothetical protein
MACSNDGCFSGETSAGNLAVERLHLPSHSAPSNSCRAGDCPFTAAGVRATVVSTFSPVLRPFATWKPAARSAARTGVEQVYVKSSTARPRQAAKISLNAARVPVVAVSFAREEVEEYEVRRAGAFGIEARKSPCTNLHRSPAWRCECQRPASRMPPTPDGGGK